MAHPWHDIENSLDSTGNVLAVVEIPKGSRIKYEFDKQTGLLKVDRILYSSVIYPANYGFIPQSLAGDGDPLDILVMCREGVAPLSIMRSRPIGAIKMKDQGLEDDKIIAVHTDDPAYEDYKEATELPSHLVREIRNFFEEYKKLENKNVEVTDFLSKQKAFELIKSSLLSYQSFRTSNI